MLRPLCTLCEKVRENPLLSLLIVLLVGLMVLFSFVMCCEPVEEWVGCLLGLYRKNEILTYLGISMGGIVLVLQAVIANRRAKAMEKQAKAQANATEEQAKANEHAEQGQRQERLKNAIEHLGHEAVSVRLGGAYELLHLAQDTPALSRTVLDILCGHIRWTTGREVYQREHTSKPSEEVQSLLAMLFVQNHEVFRGIRADLQGSWLNGANLQDAHLDNAVLTRVHLHGANLWQAYLRGTNFTEASLSGAFLGWARLHGALFWGAKLYGTNLHEAHLQGSELHEAHLQEALLVGAQIRGVRSRRGKILQSFSERMKASVNQDSKLSGVIFAGGLSPKDMDSIVEGFSKEDAGKLRLMLGRHIFYRPSNELPQRSGAVTRAYTAEEAERWITEYQNEVER